MKHLFWALLVCASVQGARFDSPDNVALDATISDGRLVTSSSSAAAIQSEIRAQLKYLVGHLFSVGAPALGHSLSVAIQSVLSGTGRKDVRYTAKFLVAWEKTRAFPSSLSLALPASGDGGSLSRFDKAYQAKCGDPASPLWYGLWFAAEARCPLSRTPPPKDAVRVTLTLTSSPLNSPGKYPEYEKIWEDGKLVVTFIGGNQDMRSAQADELIGHLKRLYGEPAKYQKTPHGSYVVHDAEFAPPEGKIEVHAFDVLSGNVQQVDANFRSLVQRYSRDSDLVAYNGHSSLGANIRAFTAMTTFKPKHYYVYWINACKPFAHLDDAIFQGVRQANPGVAPSKYLDVMAVVNLGDFGLGTDLYQLIQGMLAKRTFVGLLYGLSAGNPAVFGDEDNRWPQPFQE